MHRLPQKIKSFLFLSGTLLLFFLPLPLKAADCHVIFATSDTSSITPQDIEHQIKSCLRGHSCYPVLTDAPITYRITHIFEEPDIVYVVGVLSQGENGFFAPFSMESGWLSTKTELIYLATDRPPPPSFFNQICAAVQKALPNSLSPFHVFIQPFEDVSEDGHWQLWSFYNQSERMDFVILTIPNEDGGTDFAIMIPAE